ncbi:hypothetical protein B0H34DRAFT_692842 [Crassisporium funariophilum]|nr:hypothetical protein B0H34DRAFT_692842 [Crassisporium funariophilum]
MLAKPSSMQVENHSTPPPAAQASPIRNRALTAKQERKLVEYLDDSFLTLTSNYKKRSDISSTLRTLPEYLEAARRLLALIIQIPPIDPSTSLRIAYLLRLTGDILGAIPGYKLAASESGTQNTLLELLDFLDDLDQAWLAVLQGQVWDPASAEGVDLVVPIDDAALASPAIVKSTPPSQTEVTRLRSLLFSGESTLEEWLSNERKGVNDPDDVSGMLERMGLLDQFDSLFTRTLDYLGGFAGHAVDPGPEVVME